MIVIYATTVIVSACLLFLVQPLITKIIFPWFGGTSAIWIAALVFFQTCLLFGYAYAHWLSARAAPRTQALVHCALLLACCALMPILPSEAWRPDGAVDPTSRIFLLLAATVGLPSLLLSATSPLLQAWYVRETGSGIPLWLFALSNFGSLAALLSYPLLLEPAFGSDTLAISWSVLFVAFAALCAYVAWRRRLDPRTRETAHLESASETAHLESSRATAPSGTQRMLWIGFSACGSAVLASATIQLSTNVAPVPLLWVVPLALYLLSFILTFGFPGFYRRRSFFPFLAAALGCMAWLYTHGESQQDIRYVIPLYLLCLFVICTACHGELVQRSPPASHLTRFYLLIALGGALGGLFVSVVAPLIFDTHLELAIALIVIADLMLVLQWRRRGAARLLWPVRIAMIAGVVALTGSLALYEARDREQNVLVSRNFYGVLRIRDWVVDDVPRRSLVHGTIDHGYQFASDAYRGITGSYYSSTSAIGRTLQALAAQGPLRVGVIGLGAGVLTNYARPGDYFRVYEINPDVVEIAQRYFSFLPGALQRGADVQISMGDARLTLERQRPQRFDVLVVDAFSSDAIPTHLLTREAVELYFRHLEPDGVLAIHISNRYLDLTPVCARAAEHAGRDAIVLRDPAGSLSDASDWVLITSNYELLSGPAFSDAHMFPAEADPSFEGWTDQYSSLWPVLHLRRRSLVITEVTAQGPMTRVDPRDAPEDTSGDGSAEPASPAPPRSRAMRDPERAVPDPKREANRSGREL